MTDLIERLGPGWGESDGLGPIVSEPGSTGSIGTGPEPTRFPVTAVFLAVVAGCATVLLVVAASAHLGAGFEGALLVVAAGEIVAGVLAVVRPIRASRLYQAAVNAAALALWASIDTGRATLGGTIVGAGLAFAGCGLLATLVFTTRRLASTRWSSASVVFSSMLPLALILGTGAAVLTLPRPQATAAKAAKLTLAQQLTKNALATSARVPGESSPNFQKVAIGNDTEQAELKPFQPLDPAQQALLSQQLAEAQQAAMRLPTVAAAKAAGLILAGGMAPGVGAHYQSLGGSSIAGFTGSTFDPSKPASWIYASTANNAPVVGVMYESLAATPPAGFVGPNDYWHRHTNLCVQFGGGTIAVPFAADQNVTPQECADVHGTFMKKTVWMVHAWVVPGWASPEGVFSHANLHVYCPGNTDLSNAIGFCLRQQ
jgi:hypothetical protein